MPRVPKGGIPVGRPAMFEGTTHLNFVTWEYGTRKPCTVMAVIREPSITALVCQADGEPDTGYVALFKPDGVTAEEGERGEMVFMRGGPTGGYWKFEQPHKSTRACST